MSNSVNESGNSVVNVNASGNDNVNNSQSDDNAGTIIGSSDMDAKNHGAGDVGDQSKGKTSVVPEKYELKLPETTFLDDSALGRTADIARELGLPQEGAQKMTDFAHGEVTKYHESLLSRHQVQVGEWAKDTKADPEIGGVGFQQNAELANRVLEKFGTPELRQALGMTGYGNHPELVRVFARIGKVLGNDTLVMGNHGGSNAGKSMAEKLYPNQQK